MTTITCRECDGGYRPDCPGCGGDPIITLEDDSQTHCPSCGCLLSNDTGLCPICEGNNIAFIMNDLPDKHARPI